MTVSFRPQRDIYRVATEIGPRYYEEVIRPSFVTSREASSRVTGT